MTFTLSICVYLGCVTSIFLSVLRVECSFRFLSLVMSRITVNDAPESIWNVLGHKVNVYDSKGGEYDVI